MLTAARSIAPMPKKKRHDDGRGYRKLEMTALIQIDPEKARERIRAAYRLSGASLKDAAPHLDATERTLHRWVDQLEMREELDELTAKAKREGWLNKKRRPVKS